MAKGGYIMIDCKGLNLLADATQNIEGLYDECMAALESGVPVIAYNCEYGEGVSMTPISVFGIIEAGTIIFTSSILQIRVEEDDDVTITSLVE